MKLLLISLLIICCALLTTASAQTPARGDVYNCAKLPPFVSKKGIVQPVVIDTTIIRLPGLVIRELTGKKRLYQHPSWRQTGHVGPTVRDALGNIYVISIPSIALDTNPLENRNRVYKVDATSAEMSLFVDLPLPANATQQNPFGTLGLALDCETNSLYVSSVAGSEPGKVKGKIYQIDLKTGKILDSVSDIDGIGIAVFKLAAQKRLYFGDARSSSVFSLPLLKSGGFVRPGSPKYEFSLLAIKNGDSTQVRKIKFRNGDENRPQMVVDEAVFSYRMTAQTRDKRELEYTNGIAPP